MARTTIPAELVAINAIQGTLIADNAITAVHIATNAVSGTLVADNAITSTHIAQNNVTATQIANNTITVTQLADNAVETDKINNDAVTQAKIADDAIGPDQLAANAVVSASIANGTIVAADLADDAVTLAKMASLARGKIIYGDSAGDPAALAVGSNGQVLTTDGTDISWGAVSGGVDGITSSADATAITISSGEVVTFSKPTTSDGHTSSVATIFEANGNGDTVPVQLKVKANNGTTSTQGLYGNAGSASTDNTIVLGNSGTSGVAVGSGGEVGIGTQTPGRLLHVYANSSGDTAVMRIQDNGSHVAGIELMSGHGNWGIYNSDTVGDALEFRDDSASATRMLIDSSGKVGIGTTSPARTFHVNSGDANIASFEGHQGEGLVISSGTNGRIDIIGYDDGASSYNELVLRAQGSVDQLTLKTDGNIHTQSIFVDTTTDNSVSNDEGIVLNKDGFQVIRRAATMLYLHNTTGSGTGTLVAINKAQSTVGSITATNSNAAYNTSSDYRLKENVDYDWDATTRLKQLKPARFNWIADEENTLQDGFMAHEVENIVPEAVTGIKDAVWSAEEEANGEGIEGQVKGQQMDHSKLVPLLVKAVQELSAELDAAKARITALEG